MRWSSRCGKIPHRLDKPEIFDVVEANPSAAFHKLIQGGTIMNLKNSASNIPPDQSPRQLNKPSHQQIVIRFVLVFAFFHILFGSLDVWTTWISTSIPWIEESNPYTDISSISGLAIPEIIFLFVGSLVVGLCSYIGRYRIAKSIHCGFRDFLASTLLLRLEVIAIILISVTFCRYIAVINNLMCIELHSCLISGKYTIGNFNLSVALSGLATLAVSYVPICYLLYRVLRT